MNIVNESRAYSLTSFVGPERRFVGVSFANDEELRQWIDDIANGRYNLEVTVTQQIVVSDEHKYMPGLMEIPEEFA